MPREYRIHQPWKFKMSHNFNYLEEYVSFGRDIIKILSEIKEDNPKVKVVEDYIFSNLQFQGNVTLSGLNNRSIKDCRVAQNFNEDVLKLLKRYDMKCDSDDLGFCYQSLSPDEKIQLMELITKRSRASLEINKLKKRVANLRKVHDYQIIYHPLQYRKDIKKLNESYDDYKKGFKRQLKKWSAADSQLGTFKSAHL